MHPEMNAPVEAGRPMSERRTRRFSAERAIAHAIECVQCGSGKRPPKAGAAQLDRMCALIAHVIIRRNILLSL